MQTLAVGLFSPGWTLAHLAGPTNSRPAGRALVQSQRKNHIFLNRHPK